MGRHVCIRIREEIVHGVDNRRMEMLLMHVILEFRKLFVIFLYFQILKGNSMKRLQEETMTKMAVLGRGSMRDKQKVRKRRKPKTNRG